MASTFFSPPLASTPPQHTPGRGRRLPGAVAFRSAPASEEAGSASASRTSSAIDGAASWRTLQSSGFSGSLAAGAALVQHRSIPKSESFIKVEGFAAGGDAPPPAAASPPPSPGAAARASSLLSRQLSLECLVRPAPPPPRPRAAALAARLEASLAASPDAPPAVALPPLPAAARPGAALLSDLQARHPVFREPLAARAFHIARLAHDGAPPSRAAAAAAAAGGGFARCAGAAEALAELGADEVAVAGALLHDALDRTMLLESQLRSMLASDEAFDLVKRVSHLGYVAARFRAAGNTGHAAAEAADAAEEAGEADFSVEPAAQAARLVDLMLAQGPPRALLVRLGVALHDARALDAAVLGPAAGAAPSARGDGAPPPADGAAAAAAAARARAARDALALWAPLANRLGVWPVKAELEDRAFRARRPAEHAEIAARLAPLQRPPALVSLVDALRGALADAGVEYLDLAGRPKHLLGVARKLAAKGLPPAAAGALGDVRGLRVVVRDRADCYRALRAVERVWRLAAPPKNYIKDPKANGYQSLHAAADPGDGGLVEVQIRTAKMHFLAEYGADAAHWRYKEAAAGGSGAGREAGSKLGREGAGEGGDAAWAKFVAARAVARDCKLRPSGSPDEGDRSLAGLLPPSEAEAEAAAAAAATPGGSPAGSPPGAGGSFAEYVARTGQVPAPPAERRALVAILAGGRFSAAELAPGTTLGALLASAAPAPGAGPARRLQAVVNRQVESDPSAVLAPGDVVELYAEPASPPAAPALAAPPRRAGAAVGGAPRGNVAPLGSLGRRLAAAAPRA